jgi:hypothetical protein
MKYAIKQLSVFIENKPNELASLANILSQNNINIKSIMLAESTDFGIVRIITDTPQKAKEVLDNAGIGSRLGDVFGVRIKDKVGEFSRIISLLGNNNVNILYMYSFYEVNSGIFIFHVNKDAFEKAIEVLLAAKEDIVESEYFSKK